VGFTSPLIHLLPIHYKPLYPSFTNNLRSPHKEEFPGEGYKSPCLELE
jgi:hypothetical protein